MRALVIVGPLLLVVLGQCVSPVACAAADVHHSSQMVFGVTVSIDFDNGTSSTRIGVQAADVLSATQAVEQVELQWYGDSVFVTAIAGVQNDAAAGLWWQYWVNGQLGPVAANKYQLQDNDSVQWRREASHMNTDSAGSIDLDVLIGATAVGALGISFLGILYRRRPRGR